MMSWSWIPKHLIHLPGTLPATDRHWNKLGNYFLIETLIETVYGEKQEGGREREREREIKKRTFSEHFTRVI